MSRKIHEVNACNCEDCKAKPVCDCGDCTMCSGDFCRLCGADPDKPCEHDVVDRHGEEHAELDPAD